MPEEHAGNRVFAFFFDGRVPKAANRGAQAFDRLVPEVKGFRPSIFQGLRPQHRISSGPVVWVATFPRAYLGDRLLNGGRPLLVLEL
jgi:hypothetical protein